MAGSAGQRIVFGEFELSPTTRTLRRAGEPVRVGSRALEVLIALASRPGEVLSQPELTRLVWRDIFVEDTALRAAVSALRKSLGDKDGRHIATVPGRGYCFVAEVTAIREPPLGTTVELALPRPHPPPGLITRIIGRDEPIRDLVDEITRRRLVSIIGPGGVGKTTLAVAVTSQLKDRFDTIAFADLASVATDTETEAAIAAALGLNLRLSDPIEDIATGVAGRRVLLVLDSCEHVVEIVASLVESLLVRAPALSVLATSRETLRAVGEWTHTLQPLAAPAQTGELTAAEARRYPAVELFEDRAAFALGGYVLTDAQASLAAEICRRVDGIALAIELAAGRLRGLGMAGLARSLGESFEVLTEGRRTALPRHQTLRATLDWSYGLLAAPEQAGLQYLSVFRGWFTLDDADAILGHDMHQTRALITGLHDKSLITADRQGDAPRYRLLETTRDYAYEKLQRHGEADAVHRRHAAHMLDTYRRVGDSWTGTAASELPRLFDGQIANLHAALDWAFSKAGDPATGVELTAAAAPAWFHFSLLDDGLARVERALNWLSRQPDPDKRLMMQLYAVLGWPQMRAMNDVPSGAAAWQRTFDLAVELQDADYQMRALWAMWVDRSNNGAAREALALAERFAVLAESSGSAADRAVGHRLRGYSLHILGDTHAAREQIETMLSDYKTAQQRTDVGRFHYDQPTMAQITLARLLWLQGHAEEAEALVDRMLERTQALQHTLSFVHVLSDAACIIALWMGRLDRAQHFNDMLRRHTTLHALDVWRTYADVFDGEIMIRRGRPVDGSALVSRALATLERGGFVLFQSAFEGILAEGLIASGRLQAADAILERAIERSSGSGAVWCLPELLRLRARLPRGRNDEARELLEQGLRLARAQGATGWERRLSADLATLRQD